VCGARAKHQLRPSERRKIQRELLEDIT
jgi:hypothetical protein